jgi:hypothetical protein
MQDHPNPDEILGAVAAFLRDGLSTGGPARAAFQARVSGNALEIVRRQLALAPQAEADEQARLVRLLDQDGDLVALNGELSIRIADGRLDLQTPGLAEHLWETTLAKLAVDQPSYSGYRAALAERGQEET